MELTFAIEIDRVAGASDEPHPELRRASNGAGLHLADGVGCRKVSAGQDDLPTADAKEAWTIARRLRIAYAGLTRSPRVYGAAKFDVSPDFFTPAFRSGDVGVHEVK